MNTGDVYRTLETIENAIRSLPRQYLPALRTIVLFVIDELLAGQAPAKAKKPRKDGDNA